MSTRSQLFTSVSSELPMGQEHISILTSSRPGYTPEDPMAFIVDSELPAQVPVLSATWKDHYLNLDYDTRKKYNKPQQTKNGFGEFTLKLLKYYYT